MREVGKRQGEYPEFGHTQGEIFKKTAKKLRKPSIFSEFHPVFLFS
jgi:hypothetical protein